MEQVLAANKKYQGKYVAFDPFKDKTVVAFGKNAGMVIKKARERGVDSPAVILVPKENEVHIY